MSCVETREGNERVGVRYRRTQRRLPAASCGERLFKEAAQERKELHKTKVFDYADKKKLLFGPLSWPTELPAIGYVSKTNP